MISSYRQSFNSLFTEVRYQAFQNILAEGLTGSAGKIPFRVAETPVFIPDELKRRLERAGEELVGLISQPDFKSLTQGAIPAEWRVPHENDHPHFLTFDFGICRNERGELVPKLIEMQGFPSLYGFQLHLAEAYKKAYDLPDRLSPFFGKMKKQEYLDLLKKVVLGGHEPNEVALMDVDAPNQKTVIDFLVTRQYLGIKILSLTDIHREGRSLYYLEHGEKIWLKRIYNRLIFDEVAGQPELFAGSFDPRDDLDIEWVTHPNWFYRISKFTMPLLKSEFVPETYFLNELEVLPDDLENYVLKPLFSFAGMGVIIDVRPEDVSSVSDPENWILQRKVVYEPAVMAPDGGVKAEIRLMYLWADGEAPRLCLNLARLSRGKMIGVRYNQDFDWVGGTVGLMEP